MSLVTGAVLTLQIAHLDIRVSRRSEADPVLLVHIRGLEVAEAFPGDVVALLLVEPDLDVVLVDLVAEEEDLLATVNGARGFCQSTYGEIALGL